jgi:hypothetical protein
VHNEVIAIQPTPKRCSISSSTTHTASISPVHSLRLTGATKHLRIDAPHRRLPKIIRREASEHRAVFILECPGDLVGIRDPGIFEDHAIHFSQAIRMVNSSNELLAKVLIGFLGLLCCFHAH